MGPVLSDFPIFHDHLEIWKSPIFKCSISSPNFSVNVLAKWNRPGSPVYHLWNGSSQRSPLTHSLPFYVPGNCSQDSRLSLSLSMKHNIQPWAARSNALSLQAVLPPQKHSAMGPEPQNQSHVASQKLRAFLEIPRNPCIVPNPWQAHLTYQIPIANKNTVVNQNLDSWGLSLPSLRYHLIKFLHFTGPEWEAICPKFWRTQIPAKGTVVTSDHLGTRQAWVQILILHLPAPNIRPFSR